MSTTGIHMRKAVLMATVACFASTPVFAQEAAEPADDGLPEVEVIQKKAAAAKKAAPVTKKAAPLPSPEPMPPAEVTEEPSAASNSPYGAANSGGARARAENSPTSPINPSNILPGNLEQFSSAGSRVTYQRRFQSGADARVLGELRRHARGNSLFRNRGDGTFEDVSVEAGVTMGRWAWGASFVELNADGRPDLLVPNGFVTGERPHDL